MRYLFSIHAVYCRVKSNLKRLFINSYTYHEPGKEFLQILLSIELVSLWSFFILKMYLITYIVILLHFKAHCFNIINANKGSLYLDNLIMQCMHVYRSFHVWRWCKIIICDIADTISLVDGRMSDQVLYAETSEARTSIFKGCLWLLKLCIWLLRGLWGMFESDFADTCPEILPIKFIGSRVT